MSLGQPGAHRSSSCARHVVVNGEVQEVVRSCDTQKGVTYKRKGTNLKRFSTCFRICQCFCRTTFHHPNTQHEQVQNRKRAFGKTVTLLSRTARESMMGSRPLTQTRRARHLTFSPQGSSTKTRTSRYLDASCSFMASIVRLTTRPAAATINKLESYHAVPHKLRINSSIHLRPTRWETTQSLNSLKTRSVSYLRSLVSLPLSSHQCLREK